MAGGPAVLKFSRGLPPTRQFGERLRLLVIQGLDKGTCFSLMGDLIFLGREGCQININDSNASKKHLEISWKGSQYSVRDLGSSNGYVYNGEKVKESKLNPGDLVMVGLTVFEVYAPGQVRKNEKPFLPALAKAKGVLPGTILPQRMKSKEAISEEQQVEKKKKKEVEKKRVLVYGALGVIVMILYFSEETQTNRESKKIESQDEAPQPKKKLKKKEIEDALSAYMPNYSLDTQQRKDAEIFFRSGVREMQNKNYRRAFTAFETALTVDPTHEMAKIYLKSAKIEMEDELKSTSAAALRAKKALRFKEARMHYENIIRYLEGETGTTNKMENETNKEMVKIYDEAKKSLEELDQEENRIR
ncbi:MAG: FHA domain-containing protein [Oligoflexia bacterium]|nr:FHA domain-containing protein [Oligoflexia bacterium]